MRDFQNIAKHVAIIITFIISLTACGGGGGGDSAGDTTSTADNATNSTEINVSGAAQKGPFIVGSTVTINILSEAGENTDQTIVTTTTDNLGNFNFSLDNAELVQISSSGYYRNEITGELSTGSLTLRSIYQASEESDQQAYVNLLTHITSNRVLDLIKTTGASYNQATFQAETEFLQTFSSVVPNSTSDSFSTLTIFGNDSSTDSAYLLAVSSIMYQYAIQQSNNNATNPDAELTLLVNELESDFGSDGAIDNSSQLTAMRAVIPDINPQQVNDNISTWISGQTGYSASDINEFLDTDLDGIFNAADPYNPWSEKTAMPTARWALAASASGSNIYVTGGVWDNDTNLVLYDNLEVYNTDSDSWETKTPMQWARYHHTANIIGSKLYVVGGVKRYIVDNRQTLDEISSVEIYDIATDSWSFGPSLSMPRAMHASCVYDNKIYVFGGSTNNGVVDFVFHDDIESSVEMYDPATNKWTAKTSMPQTNSGIKCVTLNDRIYLLGGIKNDSGYDIYNPVLDTWETGGELNTPRRYGQTAAVVNGNIYLLGGMNCTPDYSQCQGLDVVDMLDTNDLSWSIKTSMPHEVKRAGYGVIDSKIYLIGGERAVPYNSTLESTFDDVLVYEPLKD